MPRGVPNASFDEADEQRDRDGESESELGSIIEGMPMFCIDDAGESGCGCSLALDDGPAS